MIATAITAGVALYGAVSKNIEARKIQKKADKAIDEFKWQELSNPYESMQVSTLGSDLLTEQTNVNTASATEALRNTGARGLAAGLGKIEAYRNNVNREIAANLDQQQKVIDKATADQEVRNQEELAKRQEAELQGLGQMKNVAMGMKYDSYGDIANSIGAMGSAFGGMNFGNTPQVGAVGGSIQPTGFATYTPPVATSSFTFNK